MDTKIWQKRPILEKILQILLYIRKLKKNSKNFSSKSIFLRECLSIFEVDGCYNDSHVSTLILVRTVKKISDSAKFCHSLFFSWPETTLTSRKLPKN